MKIAYKEHRFQKERLHIIQIADQVINNYARQGFDLTLRQLYYQFIAKDLFPDDWFDDKAGSKNSERNYKRLGQVINVARLAGYLDWDRLVDRTRVLNTTSTWDHPTDIMRSALASFKTDPWDNQDVYCETWIEKEALIGVISRVCQRYRMPFMACRGYTSQSAQWRAARRMERARRRGKRCVILHLGDHDPSGIDMTRDNEDRLQLLEGYAEVRRLALNMDQVDQYNPPPNPTKLTDSRANGYIELYGRESWELDALDPSVIEDIIEENVADLIDPSAWDVSMEQEEELIGELKDVTEKWTDVVDWLKSQN